jgi:hypothetical protein
VTPFSPLTKHHVIVFIKVVRVLVRILRRGACAPVRLSACLWNSSDCLCVLCVPACHTSLQHIPNLMGHSAVIHLLRL